MATHHRGIVSGWDSRNNRPKGVTSPADMRLSLASIARSEGIMLETGAAVTSRYGSSMSFGWSAFTAVIASPLGGWLCPRIEADTVKLAVGHSTYDRIDVIWARQWDYQVAGDHPDSEVEVGVSTGTPAASPQAPAIPSGALAIWTIRVPKGVTNSSQIPTSNITQAPWTTPVGGILTASTYEEAKALVSHVSASAINPVHVAAGTALYAWDGQTMIPLGSDPVGTVTAFAGEAAPTGWLMCDGRSVLRSAYPALFAVIGTRYGSTGSTAFNVPDLRGRAPFGAGGSSVTLAAKGGEATHTLTVNEMPSHRHEICHANNGNRHVALYTTDASAGSKWGLYSYIDSEDGSRLIANNTGGSRAHNNMPPYLGLNYIIKAI